MQEEEEFEDWSINPEKEDPAKHTPGPWTISGYHRAVLQDKTSIDGCCLTIAHMPTCAGPGHGKRYNEANARLIASAPELLRECKILIRQSTCCGDDESLGWADCRCWMCINTRAANAAIAKAEGK